MHVIPTIALALVLSLSLMVPGLVQAAQELGWRDLVPAQRPMPDPFATLTKSQMDDISLVAFLRVRQEQRPDEVSDKDVKNAEASFARLKGQGIDVDALLAERAEFIAQQQARSEAVVPELDGQEVRIPGYLLPLEHEGEQVTEFLLVPVVGACIHVPPPPPNQMVHVRYQNGFKSSSLYEPVWVNGVIKTERLTPELSLVDGSAEVEVGYTLQALEVEPYRN